ncbi:MAG: NADH:flavin oxidoreductase/NADH oxidase [Fimbriimonadaceae bacterium]|nr:NADH:flavin oxidoreductase/NADH oxidase [Fimbriimonadaceae bacterium]
MADLFEPLTLRGLTLRNRVAMSPMCTYSCENEDGLASSWHQTHLATRAYGGCGLVMAEATAVTPGGRISPQDLGIWSDDHITGLRKVVDAIHLGGAAAAIQLAHAGRKAGTFRPWSPVRGFVPDWPFPRIAPAAIPFREEAPTPIAMSEGDWGEITDAFVAATRRADAAGFDVIELHSAHGYLLHSALSPLSNPGSFEHRTQWHVRLVSAVRRVWPDSKPLLVRLSVTDWVEGGWTVDDSAMLGKILSPLGVDLIDCSSGGSVPDATIPVGPGYQVPLAGALRDSGLATGAVGQITDTKQAQAILADGKADLVFLGRELLRRPYWAIEAAPHLGAPPPWPAQYQWAVG